jgi:hypothetical protein
MTLNFRLAVLAIHLVEFMFFAGILGCAVAIIFSWVTITKDGFSKDD